jgi:hypothetical protein
MAQADFPHSQGHFRIMGFEGYFDRLCADRRKEKAVALVLGDIHAAPLFITAS